jgi:beta-glucosidase
MDDHNARHGLLPNGLDFVQPGDMETIAAPTDFLGVNYYTRDLFKGGSARALPEVDRTHATLPRTEMDWEVYPEGLYRLLCRLHFEYQAPKIYITENGAAFADTVSPDRRVHDPARVDYLRDHFVAVHRAMQAGAPVAGYFVWSLLDNFEWAEGYTKRFGLVWVDFETQQRIPKDSALWLRDAIAASGFDA